MATKIELGKKYKEDIHGMEGIAIAYCKYITGCDQVQLEWMKDEVLHSMWIDITRLKGVKVAPKDKKPGGPQAHAPMRHKS